MRVAHIVWSMTAGGLEAMLLDICLLQCGSHDVHVIIVNDHLDEKLAASVRGSYTIHRIGRPKNSRHPAYIAKLNYRIWKLKPDLIHVHQLTLINVLLSWRAPIVATVHDPNFISPGDVRRIKSIICISNAVEEAVRATTKNARTVVVHNGIRSASIRRRVISPRENFRILQVGRLVHEIKGQDLVLYALKELRAIHHDKEFQVDFFGGGPSLEFLKHLASTLQLDSLVRFLGEIPRDEVYRRLADYELLVQPSRYEGFGLTVVEAMVAEVSVIVSDVPGLLEVTDGGRFGDSFVNGDASDLAKCISLAAQRTQLESSVRCSSGRRYAVAKFDISKTVRQYEMIYEAAVRSTA